MIRLRRYSDPVHAENAAAFLRDNGVHAAVVGDHVHSVFGVPGMRFFGVDLMIPNGSDRAEAERLLEVFDSEPIEVEEGWEHAALPDLSVLDPSEIDVACPNCNVDLPLDATLERCPSCATPVDVAALIAHRHGPDVLAPCFEDESVMGFALRRGNATCDFCGYSLEGLAARGRCPECGSLYDSGPADVEDIA